MIYVYSNIYEITGYVCCHSNTLDVDLMVYKLLMSFSKCNFSTKKNIPFPSIVLEWRQKSQRGMWESLIGGKQNYVHNTQGRYVVEF